MDSEEITKEEETVEELTTTEETEEEEKQEAKKTTETRLARVEYDYEAREDDELSLNKGDVITLLEQNGEWWKGDLNGKIGMVPDNHIKLIEQSAQDGEDPENPEGVKERTLNRYGVKPGGLGSLFGGGVPTLKRRPLPESSPVSEEKHVIASPPVLKKNSIPSPVNQQPSIPTPPIKTKPPKPKKAEVEAEVMFDYQADVDDEISLTLGSRVTVLEKTDENWWYGKNEQGQIGMFPSEYVKEIKPTEVQQKSRSVSEDFTVEEVEIYESSEVTQEEVLTSEPAFVPADSIPSEVHSEDSSTLLKSPPPQSPPPTPPNRPKRQSTHESTSPISPRSHEEEYVTSRRPPSLVSPDLPPIQSISASIDTSPTSPKERPTAQKSPTLAKPPKSFSPAKPPIKRSSSSFSKSDKTKSENSPTEPVSPKISRRTSHDQYDSSTALSEPSELENKDDDIINDDDAINDEDVMEDVVEDEEQTEIVSEKLEVREVEDKEAEISDEEKEEVVTETLDTKDDEEITGGHEVEPEEKKPLPPLPPLPAGPKLSNLQKDRPIVKNRKTASIKSVKESASQSQTSILLEAVESAKDEVEQKSQPVVSPPTPPKPEKPGKPVKPNAFKLPTLGAGAPLRSVAKKPSTESTETTSTTSSTTSSGIDSNPISGGVKGLRSRFDQFGGIPNSSDVEFRLKKWFNEEINKVKSNFEAKLAEERSKREALEEEFKELILSLQES